MTEDLRDSSVATLRRPNSAAGGDGRRSATKRDVALAWAPVVGWAALIFALSAQPGLRFVPDATMDVVVRKIGHMAVFAVLALLAVRALGVAGRQDALRWALVLTIVYACSDELHQGFVVDRHASAADVAIDGIGAAFGLTGRQMVRRRALG
jgi:VanZ family protein